MPLISLDEPAAVGGRGEAPCRLQTWNKTGAGSQELTTRGTGPQDLPQAHQGAVFA